MCIRSACVLTSLTVCFQHLSHGWFEHTDDWLIKNVDRIMWFEVSVWASMTVSFHAPRLWLAEQEQSPASLCLIGSRALRSTIGVCAVRAALKFKFEKLFCAKSSREETLRAAQLASPRPVCVHMVVYDTFKIPSFWNSARVGINCPKWIHLLRWVGDLT